MFNYNVFVFGIYYDSCIIFHVTFPRQDVLVVMKATAMSRDLAAWEGPGGRRQGMVAVAFDVGPSPTSPPLPAYKRRYTQPPPRRRAHNNHRITTWFIFSPQSIKSSVFSQLVLEQKTNPNKPQILIFEGIFQR